MLAPAFRQKFGLGLAIALVSPSTILYCGANQAVAADIDCSSTPTSYDAIRAVMFKIDAFRSNSSSDRALRAKYTNNSLYLYTDLNDWNRLCAQRSPSVASADVDALIKWYGYIEERDRDYNLYDRPHCAPVSKSQAQVTIAATFADLYADDYMMSRGENDPGQALLHRLYSDAASLGMNLPNINSQRVDVKAYSEKYLRLQTTAFALNPDC